MSKISRIILQGHNYGVNFEPKLLTFLSNHIHMTISNHSLIYNKSFRTPSPGFQDRTDGIKYFPFLCFEGDISNMPPHGFTMVWPKEAQKLKAKMGSRFYLAAERISFSSFL